MHAPPWLGIQEGGVHTKGIVKACCRHSGQLAGHVWQLAGKVVGQRCDTIHRSICALLASLKPRCLQQTPLS